MAKFFLSPSSPFFTSDFDKIPPHSDVASVKYSKPSSSTSSNALDRLDVVFLIIFVGKIVGW